MLRIRDVDRATHQGLVLWAAEQAENVLPYFEKKYPKDKRPRQAIETARRWVKGNVSIKEIRKAALAAHAAARKCTDEKACFAARAAGQAVATAHTPGHAGGPVWYAIKIVLASKRHSL